MDTNLIISYLLKNSSVPGIAFTFSAKHCVLLASEATIAELRDVMSRPKFRRYFQSSLAYAFLKKFVRQAKQIKILESVSLCRDPKDDKFLDVAVNGKAHYLVTGDRDLLDLTAVGGVRIVSPLEFLGEVGQQLP